MHILMVCRDIPYPLNAGYKIRTYNLLKRLAEANAVHLVCYDLNGDAAGRAAGLSCYCSSVSLVKEPKTPKIRQIPQIMRNMLEGQPLCVKYSKSEAMRRAISEVMEARQIDLVHFDDPYIASNCNFSKHPAIKKTVTFHDIDSEKYRRMYKIQNSAGKRVMLLFDLMMMKHWEKSVLKNADLSIVMSQLDRDALMAHGVGADISVIPNGVDTQRLQFLQAPSASETISFFGALDYHPNEDAALYFCDEMLPLILQENPAAQFCIVGRNPGRKLVGAGAHPNISVAGNVDDVVPYYRKSSVAVVPLRAGGGTRLKILEAMALGCPVVSTTLGAEGLDLTDGEHILLADTPQQFARRTLELMKNCALRERMALAARSFVEGRYNWDKIAASMLECYREVVHKGP
jgi:polysaccharide biosynthesis protein PslH